MRILLITADLLEQTGRSNSYQETLIGDLVRRGHEVTVLCMAGVSFRPWVHWSFSGGEPSVYRIYNSGVYPGRYPAGGVGTRTPLRDLRASPTLRRAFWKIVERVRPDVVSIQSLLGLPFDLAGELSERGWPTVFTAHDYFSLCPTAHLFLPKATRCRLGTDDLACSNCCHGAPVYSSFRLVTLFDRLIERLARRRGPFRTTLFRLRNLSRRGLNLICGSQGLSDHYKERRRESADMLSKMSVVQCISEVQARAFKELTGPLPNLLILPLQSPAVGNCIIRERPTQGCRPLQLGALNVAARMKGGTWLLEIISKLAEEGLNFDVSIYGDPVSTSGVAGRIQQFGRYSAQDLDQISDAIDFCIIPSIWDETFAFTGVEMMARGVPLIVSRLAGVSALVEDGLNGFVFDPEKSGDLERVIRSLVGNPAMVREVQTACLSNQIKTFAEHVEEMEILFRQSIRCMPV